MGPPRQLLPPLLRSGFVFMSELIVLSASSQTLPSCGFKSAPPASGDVPHTPPPKPRSAMIGFVIVSPNFAKEVITVAHALPMISSPSVQLPPLDSPHCVLASAYFLVGGASPSCRHPLQLRPPPPFPILPPMSLPTSLCASPLLPRRPLSIPSPLAMPSLPWWLTAGLFLLRCRLSSRCRFRHS